MQHFMEVVVLSAILALSTAQVQPGGQTGQQEPSCMSQFDAALGPRCFDANGVSFQGLLSVITQGQNGQLPPNMTNEQLIQVTCNPQTQDRIIPCVIQTTNAFTNGTTCPEQERNMIAQSSFRLTQIMSRMCLQPCELQTNDRVMRCFATLQLPTDRIMNSSMIDDKFALIGNTSAEVQRFCNNHGALFTCLETEKAQCAAFERTMFEMGIDFTAMKQATAILCQKQQEYLAAEKCFQDNIASTQQCMMATGRDMQALLIGRFQMGTVPPSTMTNRLCAVRMTKVPCELQTYQQACSQHVVMRNEFECNILAEPCRGIPNLQPVLTNMCSSSTPPEQQITPRPPVVANNNINDFTNNNNMNNNFNNNNNFRSANSVQGNGAGSSLISLTSTLVLVVSALILH